MASEPRLIDAEQLKRYLRRVKLYTIKIDHYHYTSGYIFDDVFAAIDRQPTITTAVPGYWKKVWGEWTNGFGWKYACSECGVTNKQYAPPFCPHCGATMNGGICTNETPD